MDYPSSFEASDKASLITQRNHIRFSIIVFLSLTLAALFSGFVFDKENSLFKPFTICVIASLLIATILKFVIKIYKWDKKWFDGRAVAESIKTATWRYVMGVKPFGIQLSPEEIDKKFTAEVAAIIQSRPAICEAMSTCLSSGKQITDKMRETRSKNVEEKKVIYLNERIKDQRSWYTKKAAYNGRQENCWFAFAIIAQVLAIILAFCKLYMEWNVFSPIGFITTLASIFVAWVEMKKFQELSQSYALAAQELASAESLLVHVGDQTSLATYVNDTENAISREHTMWCAKRS